MGPCCEKKKLGSGTFGSVYLAKYGSSSQSPNVVKYYNSIIKFPFLSLYTLLLITDRMVVSNGAHRFIYIFVLTFYNNKSSRDNS